MGHSMVVMVSLRAKIRNVDWVIGVIRVIGKFNLVYVEIFRMLFI